MIGKRVQGTERCIGSFTMLLFPYKKRLLCRRRSANLNILTRFRDIMASNIHALLDKAEDPEKMINQYMRTLSSDLGKVKSETASIMAAEIRAKRELTECTDEMNKMKQYAIKALESNNEADARKFLERKSTLATKEKGLKQAYEISASNAKKMRAMHDKLISDMTEMESRLGHVEGKAICC